MSSSRDGEEDTKAAVPGSVMAPDWTRATALPAAMASSAMEAVWPERAVIASVPFRPKLSLTP
jgi:hypothetical protein